MSKGYVYWPAWLPDRERESLAEQLGVGHSPECHLRTAYPRLNSLTLATPQYSDSWGLGCDCFAF